MGSQPLPELKEHKEREGTQALKEHKEELNLGLTLFLVILPSCECSSQIFLLISTSECHKPEHRDIYM